MTKYMIVTAVCDNVRNTIITTSIMCTATGQLLLHAALPDNYGQISHTISRGLAPTYLQGRCRLASEVSSGRRLRSANVPMFVVPRTRTKLRDCSFAAAWPRLYGTVCQGLCVNPRHSQPSKDN